ncbi:SDR family NAD(P)-dependent oxidoreductase [Streptomyces californicus]|uniref:SDR family NAD(P)-dependent oxidoreductase n=1 Tax=Streptomyces californicus TaxID=67351 RepID=UPI00382F569D
MENEAKLRDYLKRATADLRQTRTRLRELEDRGREPIAIVGMACRFPGGVSTPEDLWRLLADERDTVTCFPADRGWDVANLVHPDPDNPGTSTATGGAFLDDAAAFDAGFFGISPREALAMDPQQRLLLETSWEALERAGIDPASLHGSDTGVYVGTYYQGYGSDAYYGAGGTAMPESVGGHLTLGGMAAAASGRISYAFGLEGPAVSMDTACSSSAVAVHTAVRALRQGECSLALVGGAAINATPAGFIDFSRMRALSDDGRCKPFAAAADGTGWGEGIGVLLVERLSDARRNGHPVLAVIRGSAIGQDGASNGLTAPNGLAQQRVIRQALTDAGLSAADIDAVEAHGTGTTLGDPIEAEALLATYGRERTGGRPLWLGSVKSNVGHTQGASGIAGIIKMVQALRYGTLPRTLHIDEPSPHVDWTTGTVQLLDEARPWPETGRPRRAGVSSFGGTGTISHLILEEAPEPEETVDGGAASAPAVSGGAVPWVLSGRSPEAVRAQAARLVSAVAELDPADVGLTLASRSVFDHRAVVLGGELAALAEDRASGAVVSGSVVPGGDRAVFVFPGQGSQWVGMAAGLRQASPVFRDALRACGEALGPFVEWELEAVLDDEAMLQRVDVVQPVLWAVMVSLAAVWRACGVEPAAVVGHSQGEIAAAVVAGGLSLEDGARVVALRSQAIVGLAGRGGMVSVPLPVGEVEQLLSRVDGLSVAAVNGPRSVVVSGAVAALDGLVAICQAEDIRARRIAVDYASHSAQVEEIRDEVLSALAPVGPVEGGVPFYSAVTGGVLDPAGLDAAYWYENLRRTVRFEEAVRALLADGHGVFVECSAHPVLSVGIQETVDAAGSDAVTVGTLRRGKGGPEQLLASLSEAYVHGVDVDWQGLFPGARPVDLPTYAFQRERYWLDPAPVGMGDLGAVGLDATGHPLIGAAIAPADSDGVVLTGRLLPSAQPWLADHVVGGAALLPATALLDLALHAGAQVGCDLVEELTLESPLVLHEHSGALIQVTVGAPDPSGSRPLAVYSRGDDDPDWVRRCGGTLATGGPEPVTELVLWPPSAAEPLSVDGLYDRLAAQGAEYGPAFQGLRAAWRRGDDLFVEIAEPAGSFGDTGYALHPVLLGTALNALALDDDGDGTTRMPFMWTGARLHTPRDGGLRVRLSPAGDGAVSLLVADAGGMPVATVASMVLRPVSPGNTGALESLYRIDWTTPALPATPAGARAEEWAVLGPDDGKVAALLESAGATVVHRPGLAALDTVPDVVFLPIPDPSRDTPHAPHEVSRSAVSAVLATVQEWLADERFTEARLVVAGRGAGRDPAQSAAWGLIRAAQQEHPDRIVLLDIEETAGDIPWPTLPAALRSGEPELALREDAVVAPRLSRVTGTPASTAEPVRLTGTVLVTGASGGLGMALARHLATTHDVRGLVLAARRGDAYAPLAALADELRVLGVEVRVPACDVSDPLQTRQLIDSIAELTAIVHTAAVLDDSVVTGLTPDQLDRVLAPKADAARHLHELTRDRDLSAFVLFSSVAGRLSGVGQGSYTAANAAMEAVAAQRRSEGLPGTALAWGLWSEEAGMGGRISTAALQRTAQSGVAAMTTAEGLALFDAALAVAEPVLLPVRLDPTVLRGRAKAGTLPVLLSDLVRVPRRDPGRADDAGTPVLAGASRETMVELVRAQVAAVLGHPGPASVAADRAFTELGLDSIIAVQLRNRLNAATGLKLPATLAFDHPTPEAVAAELAARLSPGQPGQADDEHLRTVLASLPISRIRAAGLLAPLLALAGTARPATPAPAEDTADIDAMDLADLVQLALDGTES